MNKPLTGLTAAVRPAPVIPRRILVAMDGSSNSFEAWVYAERMRDIFGSRLEAFYVHDPAQLMPLGDLARGGEWAVAESLEQAERDIMAQIRRQIGIKTTLGSGAGNAAIEILKYGQKSADWIMMGHRGISQMERLFLGSTAEAVIRLANIPVCVVPRRRGGLRSILAPVNFKPYSQETLVYAAKLAKSSKARLTALHVADTEERAQIAKALLKNAQLMISKSVIGAVDFKASVLKGNAIEQILTESRHHDLVVLSGHRKTLVQEIVIGNTAERVLRHIDAPTLVVPAAKPV